ncbi:hypothetical protein MLD38_039548 [Melastoma candidum]|uniref:Uncharacterized protein n=1 Tax=Melastoma candidum TaxID=119954 RepID=A0ACB9L4S3_9MYRT|nr:hypothetical protein MLD38_039548 [Melastoma candidum]
MSTSSSVRRLKDRGGAGARTSAAKSSIKPLTPLSSSKENIGPYSKISDSSKSSVPFPAEKPVFRAIPRASSVPKGRTRASSPLMRPSVESGKGKIGSVFVGAAGPRVSLDGAVVHKEKLSGGGVRVLTDLKDKVRKRSGLCESGDGKSERADGVLKDSSKVEALSSEKLNLDLITDLKIEKGRNAAGERVLSQVLQRSAEKDSNFTGDGNGKAGVKYPSKLHEKLAFLEGKVKRIASDIKRTKEMLDQTNPDDSKCVLSDIQETISGIEKAMNDDVSMKSCNSDGKKSSLKENGSNVPENVVETGRRSKFSVKGMDNEELEARLFPHHMLLRNRKSSSVTVPSSSEPVVDCVEKLEVAFKLKDEEKSARSIDENAITSEFLESLKEDQLRISKDDVKNGVGTPEVQETDGVDASSTQGNAVPDAKVVPVISLMADETLDEYDDQENRQDLMVSEEKESPCSYFLSEIGKKSSTGGWFVSDGEAVLLAHNDGSCSYHDIVNSEEKAEYRPPASVSPGMWRDCWIIRAPSADGCSGRYVVAASAGNALDAGFCSWDFYTKDLQASHIENDGTSSRTILGPLPSNSMCRRNVLSTLMVSEPRQWWYKPCGPLMVSMATSQRIVRVYDIRDGEQVLKWEVQKPVAMMDHSSPLHWRSRGKVVVAESEAISLWDVNALTPQALLSVPLLGQKLSALHVNNTDAEMGGGVRQRISSSEVEGNDGVYCCDDSINVLDFRHPSGIGLRIQKLGVSMQSVFSRGDSVYVGCSNLRISGKKNSARPEIQQFSLRQQSLFSAYSFPESNDHPSHAAITQVWGNSSLVMGVNGQGLFVFDATKDEVAGRFLGDQGITSNQKVREVIGPDDLYTPSFDYALPRALLISRDRPAMLRCLT